jgi:hypothetical protein
MISSVWKTMDTLRDAIPRSIQLSELMKAEPARHHLLFGVGRRLLMLWYAYRNLLYIAPSTREEPLTSDESGDLTQDLNVIYINICGVLDNLCWALLHEHAPDKVRLPPWKVGLFLPCMKDPRFASLTKLIQARDAWDREVKCRRNPAAHRIPLTVPPSVLTGEEEKAMYKKLSDDYSQATSKLNFDEAEDIMRRIDGIGHFVPYFMHDPEQRLIPIYPTVADDIEHVIDLFRAIDTFLVSERATRPSGSV